MNAPQRRRLQKCVAVAGLAAAAAVASAPAALAGTLDPSPHNYMGDGSATDTYGSGSLTWSGTPSYVPVANSYSGDQAFYFNGSSYLTAPNSTIVNYGTRNFSLSAKFATTTDTQQDLVTKRGDSCAGAAAGPVFDIRTLTGPDRVQATLSDSAGNGVVINLPFSFADGAYHTIFFIRSGNSVTLAVDGNSTQATSTTAVNLDTAAPLELASGPCVGKDGTSDLTGALDAVQFNVTVAPGVALPEAPYSIALVLSAGLVIGAAAVVRNRRHTN